MPQLRSFALFTAEEKLLLTEAAAAAAEGGECVTRAELDEPCQVW